jgi:hypothetical protein
MDISLLEVRDYALAARRDDCWYRVRHSAEQKWITWPACSSGKEISGETCVPQYGSRCKVIERRAASGRSPVPGALVFGNRPDEDTGVTFRSSIATTLRRSHAIPWPVHRSIRSCKLTQPTLSSGSMWPSLPRVFLKRQLFSALRNQAGHCHLMVQPKDAPFMRRAVKRV